MTYYQYLEKFDDELHGLSDSEIKSAYALYMESVEELKDYELCVN